MTEITPRIMNACEIATGRSAPDEGEAGYQIIAAKKDLNAKGNGPEWYRLVHRCGEWQYVSEQRLPAGTHLARDRRASVYGEVYVGEIVVSHDRGGPIGSAWLVATPNSKGLCLIPITFAKLRSGEIEFKLPDGSTIRTHNPRTR